MSYFTTFTDTLARADENPWSDGGVMTAGSALLNATSVPQLDLQLKTNAVCMSVTSDTKDGDSRVNSLALPANQWVGCRIAAVAGADTNKICWCDVRASLADAFFNCYRAFVIVMATGNTATITKMVASAKTTLASTTAGSWAAGANVRLTALGSVISLFKNDNLFLTVPDATYPSGASVGYGISLPTTSAVGDLTLDTIEAGTFDPSGVVFPRNVTRRRGLPIPFLR